MNSSAAVDLTETPNVYVTHRLTVVAKKSFGLFALCRHEASNEVVTNGCQQDDEEDNLSLMTDRETESKTKVGPITRTFSIFLSGKLFSNKQRTTLQGPNCKSHRL